MTESKIRGVEIRKPSHKEPLTIFEESKELQLLATYKKVDFIKTGEENLSDLVTKATEQIGKKPVLIHIMGAPGSGKSYIRRLIESHFKKKQKDDKSITVHNLAWDRVEAELIKRRNQDAAVFTPDNPSEPFKTTELQIVNSYFNSLLSYSMGGLDLKSAFATAQHLLADNPSFKPQPNETKENFERRCFNVFKRLIRKNNLDSITSHSVLLVEQPGATALKDPRTGWQEPHREYSTRTPDDVLHQRDMFAGVDRDKWYIAAVGTVGGSSMEVFDHYRDDLKQIRSLDEANAINQTYGLETFTTNSQWYAARTGATRIQMLQARISIWATLKDFVMSPSKYRSHGDSPLPFYLRRSIIDTHKIIGQRFFTNLFQRTLPDSSNKEKFAEFRSDVRKLMQIYPATDSSEGSWLWPIMYNYASAAILENNLCGLNEKDLRKRPDATAIVASRPPFPEKMLK